MSQTTFSSKNTELTPVEKLVVDTIIKGCCYTNKQIAEQLNTTIPTIRGVLHSLYCKLGVRNKAGILHKFQYYVRQTSKSTS